MLTQSIQIFIIIIIIITSFISTYTFSDAPYNLENGQIGESGGKLMLNQPIYLPILRSLADEQIGANGSK